MNKKIAVLLSSEPQVGGEHQYAALIADCLYRKYEMIAVCTTKYWVTWCKEHHVNYIKYKNYNTIEDCKRWIKSPSAIKYYYWFFSEIGNFLRRENVDVLVVTRQGTIVPPLPCKVIQPAHDLMHRYEKRFPEACSAQQYDAREALFQRMAKYTDVILTDSKLGKKQFEESYRQYLTKRTKIISLPFIAPPHIWENTEEPLDISGRYIFYPAQFWSHKNHLNLIKAVDLLKGKIPDIKLVLVGSEKNSLKIVKKYIVDNGLENHVFIYGFVSDENINYLYKHAVMMVMPSYFGPTNIPPLEAMALGCPVAVSNNYAMGEQVGNAGLLFSPDSPQEIADCIYKVWTDDELRKKMIQEGYKQTDKWNREKFEKKLIRILEET